MGTLRRLARMLGSLLVVGSLAGAAWLYWMVATPPPEPAAAAQTPANSAVALAAPADAAQAAPFAPSQAANAPAPGDGVARPSDQSASYVAGPVLPPAQPQPITHLTIPSIDVDTPVAPATAILQNGVLSWQVPPFVAGHAEGTADAGQPGNAVLFGHVTSMHSGQVFEHLDKVAVGDLLQIDSGANHYQYRVVVSHAVPRTDVAVVQPTTDASATLITCTGIWVPIIWDYNERWVVHADLVTATGALPE